MTIIPGKRTKLILKPAFLGAVAWILLFICVSAPRAQYAGAGFSDGVSYYEHGDYENAIGPLKRAVDENPRLVDAYIYLASAYLGAEQFDQTIQTAREGLKVAPKHLRLLLLKAEGYYRSDYRKAIPVYREIATILERNLDRQKDGLHLERIRAYLGHLYHRRANESYGLGQINKAVQDYEQARQYSPDSLNIHNNLAYILLQEERWGEAVELLEETATLFPGAERTLFMKGQAHRGAGELDEMVEAYQQLYQADPENLNYAVIYGQSLMAANQARRGNLFMQKLIDRHPREKRLYEVLKKMNEQRYDFGARRNVLKLQRQAFPQDRAVAEDLARTHLLIQEYPEARQIYDSLATATLDPEYAIQAARTWLYDENYAIAAEVYQKMTDQWPDDADLLAEAAVVFEEAGDTERAQKLYRRAYNFAGEPLTVVKLIELLLQDKKNEEAFAYLEELEESGYSGIGKFYELKYRSGEMEEDERAEKAEQAVVEMLRLYENEQQEARELSAGTFNSGHAGMPPVLQIRRDLDRLEHYIDDWYAYLRLSFSSEECLQILENVISEYSSSPKLYLFRGQTAIDYGDPDRGMQSLEEAVRLGAQEAGVHLALGNAYAQLGKVQAAILSYERALTLDNEYKEVYHRLIRISRENELLDELCNRWLARYSNNNDNNILKEHLIEALHKADRTEEANRIIRNG
ncbi:tetratricopeptide repeat protein [Halalkalibaculum sp. DA3122]